MFVDRCREDLAGRSAEPFGFTNGREGPADLGELVRPPPALVVALLLGPKPRRCKVGLAYRPLVCEVILDPEGGRGTPDRNQQRDPLLPVL